MTVAVAALAAAAGIAACGGGSSSGGSSSKSFAEIKTCLEKANLSPTDASVGSSKELLVAIGSGQSAPVGVASSDSEARKQAKEWKDFGAAAGKSGTTRIEGGVWVGYPGSPAAALKSKIEDCAF